MSEYVKVMDAIEGAENVATLIGVKKGDDVLIYADTSTDIRVPEAIAFVCRKRRADVTISRLVLTSPPAKEPPKNLANAMKAADVVIQTSKRYSYFYADARREAENAGVLFQGVAASSLSLLTGEGARFPLEIVFEIATKAEEQIKKGKTMHITCDRGSDLTLEIDPKLVKGAPKGPLTKYPKARTGFNGGCGSLHLYPHKTANGVVYFESIIPEGASRETFKAPLDVPIKFTVKDGQVTKVEGGSSQVSFYENNFEKFGENARHFGEIGIGLNPKADLNYAEPLQMERHAGVLHTGIGSSWGRRPDGKLFVEAGVHVDAQLGDPTITIDGEVFVENGKLILLEDPDIESILEKFEVTP